MVIKNVKDLKKVIDLCRKTGVSDIEIAGIKMHIGPITDYGASRIKTAVETFPEASVRVPAYSPVNVQETANAVMERIDMPDELSQEQLMFYSAKQEPQ